MKQKSRLKVRNKHFSEIALNARKNTLAQIYNAKSGHPGGSLSCIEILVSIFLDVHNKSEELKLILSKGHAAPAFYAVAAEFGLLSFKDLYSFRKINGKLQGHPHIGSTPWVISSTGSLGQGFSAAVGISLALKHKKELKSMVYSVIGDGELQEGEIWEGAMFAAHHSLSNLCVFIDYNKMQSDDLNKNIMNLEPLVKKWEAFNWNVLEIDGHNHDALLDGINFFKKSNDKPTIIIANTIKGYGVSFMEAVPTWHGSVTMKESEFIDSLKDLNANDEEIKKYLNNEIW